MKQVHRLTGLIEREGDGYVSLCPELDLASQGETIGSQPVEPDVAPNPS